MKAKTIKEILLETGAGGAGYAVWGGGWGRSFGNPSSGGRFAGRGFGFGAGNNSGGPNMMYTYDIVPLNHTLEPEVSNQIQEPVIHTGSVIKGKVLGQDKHMIGQILSTKEDHDNNVMYYVILDIETGTKVKIDPTSAFIWEPEPEGADPVGQDYVANESIKMPSLKNFK